MSTDRSTVESSTTASPLRKRRGPLCRHVRERRHPASPEILALVRSRAKPERRSPSTRPRRSRTFPLGTTAREYHVATTAPPSHAASGSAHTPEFLRVRPPPKEHPSQNRARRRCRLQLQ